MFFKACLDRLKTSAVTNAGYFGCLAVKKAVNFRVHLTAWLLITRLMKKHELRYGHARWIAHLILRQSVAYKVPAAPIPSASCGKKFPRWRFILFLVCPIRVPDVDNPVF